MVAIYSDNTIRDNSHLLRVFTNIAQKAEWKTRLSNYEIRRGWK